jgi:hypothetical protein
MGFPFNSTEVPFTPAIDMLILLAAFGTASVRNAILSLFVCLFVLAGAETAWMGATEGPEA